MIFPLIVTLCFSCRVQSNFSLHSLSKRRRFRSIFKKKTTISQHVSMWMIHTQDKQTRVQNNTKKRWTNMSIELLWCILSHRREIATKNRPTRVDSEKKTQHVWFTNSHVNIWWLLFIVLPFERNVYNSSTASPKLNHSEKKNKNVNKRESITDKWNNQKVCKICSFYRLFWNIHCFQFDTNRYV